MLGCLPMQNCKESQALNMDCINKLIACHSRKSLGLAAQTDMLVPPLQHAMRNDSNDFCCYLLCRHYAADDDIRWPYIQYKVGHRS